MSITDLIGCSGGVLLLGAYLLNSKGKLGRESVTYQAMNLFGAGGLSINVFAQGAWPTFVVEAIWTLCAFAMLRNILRKKHTPQEKS